MKIYKPTFDDFLEEVQEPVYLLIHTVATHKNIINRISVSATGYNQEKRAIHYITLIGESFNMDKEVYEEAQKVIADMRRQVACRNLSFLPGIISEETVLGEQYEMVHVKETLDISSFAKTDPDGNEIIEEDLISNPKSIIS